MVGGEGGWAGYWGRDTLLILFARLHSIISLQRPPPQVPVFSHLVVVRSFFSRFALSGDWAEEGDGGGLGRGGGRGCGGRGALTLPLQQLRFHSLVDFIEFFRDAVVRVAGFQGTEVHFREEVSGLFDVAVEEELVSFPLSLDLQ